jgi:hypothetical protein
MFYYLSVIGILVLPSNQGVIENSITGSQTYKKHIENIIEQAPSATIFKSECREKDKEKGKAS